PNQPPTVSLTAPANGATYTAPATVNMTANASDPENRLSKVEFYNGATLLGTSTAAPYAFTWSSVAAGTYTLKAKAYDLDGASTSSATVTITVNAGSSTTPGLVAGYAFAEGAGTTTGDASGNGISGTLTGGAGWGTGKNGSSVVFNGATS